MVFSRIAPAALAALAVSLLIVTTAVADEPSGQNSNQNNHAGDHQGQPPGNGAPQGAHHHEAQPNSPASQIVAQMQQLSHEHAATTDGKVTINGQTIAYTAKAGTITLYGKGDDEAVPTARMFYVAYFKKGVKPGERPITFIYNGGPGSASMWLHMGAFGPKRVITNDHTHTPAAPYKLVDNQYSLLNASDLVFVDAPGTGYSRLIAETPKDGDRESLMKKRQKHFYSVDGDADAFAQFITSFISKYNRWNSPKYLFGESYGTTRSAVLADDLANDDNIDLNGVMLLSQILNFDLSIDGPKQNPGQPLPYALALPSFAAVAWYHHKLPGTRPDKLQPFLQKVESFATGPYLSALIAGDTLSDQQEEDIAQQLHQYTGLPVAYWKKANLRVDGSEFEKNLLADDDESTGRLDARFAGPSLDPLSEGSRYDPQSASISSAYVSAFNHYVRDTLHYDAKIPYRPVSYQVNGDWNFGKQNPNSGRTESGPVNVMPQLADAIKKNPNLQIMLNGGYFDLATPFYTAMYEMHHLPIPKRLADNITYHWYQSGHMVYVHVPSLEKLHANVTAFINRTDNLGNDNAGNGQGGSNGKNGGGQNQNQGQKGAQPQGKPAGNGDNQPPNANGQHNKGQDNSQSNGQSSSQSSGQSNGQGNAQSKDQSNGHGGHAMLP